MKGAEGLEYQKCLSGPGKPRNPILKFPKWWAWLGATSKIRPKMTLHNMRSADFISMAFDGGVFSEYKNPT